MTLTISEKIKEINVLMTIFVVALHIMTWENRMWTLRIIVNMAIPLFFVISSYLYFQNYSFTWKCYKNKVLSRLKSLYIPFIIYNIIYIPWMLFKLYILHFPDTRQISILSIDTITSIIVGLPETLNPVLWFLRVLIVFVFLAPIIGIIVTYLKWIIIPLSIIYILFIHHFDYYSFLYWIPCLLLGTYLSFYENKILQLLVKIKKNMKNIIYLNLTIISYFIFFIFFLKDRDIDYSYHYFIYRMTIPYIVIVFYSTINHILPKKIINMISPYTFPIYCMHIVFVNMSVIFISLIIPNQWFLLIQLISFILAFTLVFFVCKMLSRSVFLWPLLTGFRN